MKKILIVLAITLFVFACSDDKSSDAEIIDLTITNLSSTDLNYQNTSIDSEMKKIYIFLDNDLTEFIFPITLSADIRLSSGAKTSSISSGDLIFANSDEVKTIEVEAEDGTLKNWYIYLFHRQIQNSAFEYWFDNQGMNGKIYQEIGSSSVTSVWATANMGTSIYDVHCTQPLTDGSNTLVEIYSGETGNLPITAGTIFTGIFNVAGAISHPTDPEQATIFGIPFTFRPTAIKYKFKYQSGDRYILATLNDPNNIFGGFTVTDIEGEDKCSMEATLEIRNGDQVNEIARAELFSETTDDVLTEITIPFIYTSNNIPTHISVMFSSSTEGDIWKGSVGSTLVIDDVELVYE
ncbi:PCMD domain-containing protein [Bacteroidota bacterium]